MASMYSSVRGAVEWCVGGLPHLSDAAFADLGGDGVGAEAGAGAERRGRLGRSRASYLWPGKFHTLGTDVYQDGET